MKKIAEEARELLRLAEEFGLEELDVEIDGMKFKATRSVPESNVSAAPVAVIPAQPAPAPVGAAQEPAAAPAPPPPASTHEAIVSPMVGTFYRAPSPDKPEYVSVGDVVGPETVVCIVEAMKLMNEIKAGLRGKIVSCSIANAEPVKAGQALFLVDPS
ncbi:MAG: acetyl-CoA carboxylase biotin carboxyl carrier protein [Candidatus Wallbacteria bacterium]|nr:acetyl-CoA carboxylase biotin carboxyl carrier protein [Candidatus Wallbacteria bacterium]